MNREEPLPAILDGPGGEDQALEELLARLEEAIGRLSDHGAPLDRLVSDYEQACRLLEMAQSRLDAATRLLQELQPGLEAPVPAIPAEP
jgi:exodeoxyribonuclease VII small subunit